MAAGAITRRCARRQGISASACYCATVSADKPSSNPAFTALRGLVKFVAIAVGGAVTVISLMSVAGIFLANDWLRLAIALLVATAVPAVLADRLLPEDTSGGRGKGVVTDVFAVTWLGVAFAFVVLGGSVTQPYLHVEAGRQIDAGIGPVGEATFWLAGSSATDQGTGQGDPDDDDDDDRPAGSATAVASSQSGSSEAGQSGGDAGAGEGDASGPEAGAGEGNAGAGNAGGDEKNDKSGGDTATAGNGETGDNPSPGPDGKLTPAAIFKTWAPSVVTVAIQKGMLGGGGTGFLIGSDGTLVTNHHVIDGAKDVRVKMMDGTWADRVDLLAQDPDADLAILRITVKDAASGTMPPVKLGDSDDVQVGEQAISIGNPLGLEHTLTDGLISARRKVSGRRMLQMSTPISPGNSGGPLFNLRGEVIGVSTATMSAFGSGQNLNLAVPSNTVKEMLKDEYPDEKRIGGGGPDMGRW